ncbi:type VII secretion target [Homoserinimonas sp. A447]
MAEQLIVDTEFLRDTAAHIATVKSEFENANGNSEDVATAVGHAGLAERVRGFASNWDHRRSELVEQLTTVHDNLVNAADGFEATDTELAVAIEGDQ